MEFNHAIKIVVEFTPAQAPSCELNHAIKIVVAFTPARAPGCVR